MVELHHLLLLPPAIGADLEHCLMKLFAAPSISETELSLTRRTARPLLTMRWRRGLAWRRVSALGSLDEERYAVGRRRYVCGGGTVYNGGMLQSDLSISEYGVSLWDAAESTRAARVLKRRRPSPRGAVLQRRQRARRAQRRADRSEGRGWDSWFEARGAPRLRANSAQLARHAAPKHGLISRLACTAPGM